MQKKQEYSILGLLAVLLITMVSTCSPLYPVNPSSDANIYLVIGRGMADGLVPYRDLYDQKGPILYMLHALSSLISRNNFFGIYILEIVCCFCNLIYILKTMRLWLEQKVAFPLAIATGSLIYCAIMMGFGDTTEELTLPILTASFYVFFKYAKHNTMPSLIESFLIGIGIALIFWIKFTIVAPYAGALLVLILLGIHRQDMSKIGARIGIALLGFLLITGLVALYFAQHGAMRDMLDGYLLFNIFHYNLGEEGTQHQSLWIGYFIIYIVAFVGLLLFVPDKWPVRLMFALSLGSAALLLVTVFCYFYYYQTLLAFLPPLAAWLCRGIRDGKKTWAIAIAFSAFVIFTNFNFILLLENHATSYAVPMAKMIEEEGVENPNILTYNMLNAGLHVQANATPRIKYFFTPHSLYPEIMKQQNEYLTSREAVWVVTTDSLPSSLGYQKVMTTYDYDRGVVLYMFLHNEIKTPVHLYRRIDEQALPE